MKILVTGAGGFVGRALLAELAGKHQIVAVDAKLDDIGGIEGDICDPAMLKEAVGDGCDAVVHLATVPGGAAELDPAWAKRVNIDTTMALIDAVAAARQTPRFVFASSIAVFGDPLPAHIDDRTPLAPRMLYGAHKAMIETWIEAQTRCGAICGLSLRLPGIVARPKGPSGMKSAFMSDLFHALAAKQAIELPVSPQATMWLMSVRRVARNIVHAIETRATGSVTLPALRVSMSALVDAVARATGADSALVTYVPEHALEAAFGRQPQLSTPQAEAMGFAHDGTLDDLVASAIATLS